MASQLTETEVAHIAELARVELSPAERETFARQLTDILSYAAIVQDVETGPSSPSGPSGLPSDLSAEASAAAEALAKEGPGREDVAVPSVSRDEVIEQAPDGVLKAGLFRVPKVL